MNKIWVVVMLAACAVLTFTKPAETLPAMVSAANSAVTLSLSLMALYIIWLGILRVAEATGVMSLTARIFKKPIRFLFGETDEETAKYISMNFSANLLGMGNAATPMGVNAMCKLEDGSDKATDGAIMLVVLNSVSITLVPTTVISLRVAGGSVSAADIILPSLLAALVSAAIGIGLCKLCARIRRRKARKAE